VFEVTPQLLPITSQQANRSHPAQGALPPAPASIVRVQRLLVHHTKAIQTHAASLQNADCCNNGIQAATALRTACYPPPARLMARRLCLLVTLKADSDWLCLLVISGAQQQHVGYELAGNRPCSAHRMLFSNRQADGAARLIAPELEQLRAGLQIPQSHC
jgi:hypothetical protein